MSADMLIATIPLRPDFTAPDFAAGRTALSAVEDPTLFDYQDPESDITKLIDLPAEDIDLFEHDTEPYMLKIEWAKKLGAVVIDALEQAFTSDSNDIDRITSGHRVTYYSGGLSWGDAPTEAAQAMWDVSALPIEVQHAMGIAVNSDDRARFSRNEISNALSEALSQIAEDDPSVTVNALNEITEKTMSFLDDIENLTDKEA